MAWKVSGRNCLTEEFRKKQLNLLPDQEEQVLWGVRSPPVKSGLAGVINGKTDGNGNSISTTLCFTISKLFILKGKIELRNIKAAHVCHI